MTMVQKLRQHALNRLEKLSYQIDPEYLKPRIYNHSTSLSKNYSLEGFEKNVLVFENDAIRLDLSSLEGLKKAIILPFKEAYRSYGPLLESFHDIFTKKEKDPLFFAHIATFQDGVFLYIPPHSNTPLRLQVLYLSSSAKTPIVTTPRLHIVLGANTTLEVAETRVHEGKGILHTNMLTSFDLGASSSLYHTHQTLTSQEEKAYSHLRASVQKDAYFSSTTFLSPHQTLNQRLVLKEENARCKLQGAWMAEKRSHPVTCTHVEHHAGNTHSSQLFKGIVEDEASSSFSGLITIAKEANKSTARQLNQNILLGKDSKAVSKPQLEIKADDVQATHGSTTGKIDDQAILYMQSRGITLECAKKLLLQGFIREITKELPIYHNNLLLGV